MNLGEALRIAESKFRHKRRNEHQNEYRKRKMQEPGWWARQLKLQNERRRNNGIS